MASTQSIFVATRAFLATDVSSTPPLNGIVPCEAEANTHQSDSLNSDPYNLRAEELAMKDCTLGVDVRRTWTEKEMVRSIDGRLFPGTPDGMFEDWDGTLTCVQVVRVPLVSESIQSMQSTLANTIISKVVKSQRWLRASPFTPKEFIIFCWLPFTVTEDVAEHAENVMSHVQRLDSRFSLRLRIPGDPDSLFPALFACNKSRHVFSYSWSDVATHPSTEDEQSDDEYCFWDITWSWSDQSDDSPIESALLCNMRRDIADERVLEDIDCDLDVVYDDTYTQREPVREFWFSEVCLHIVIGFIVLAGLCGICIENIRIENG